MVALSVIDFVLSTNDSAKQARSVATRMVATALAELEQLNQIEADLPPVDCEAPFNRPRAAMVRAMYEDWASPAQALLERVLPLGGPGQGQIPRLRELFDAHGRTRARLSLSLEAMEESHNDLLAGRVVTAEEVRRELRARIQQAGNP